MQFDLKTYEKELRSLVNIDSGSTCIDGVNTVMNWFLDRYRKLGWKSEIRDPEGDYGKTAFVWNNSASALDVLIICHTDTVFPDETAKNRPFSVVGNRYKGPGVADMKAGCLMALHSMEQLHADGRLKGNVGIILNGEHELSCPTVRPYLEEISRRAKVVLTTEAARPDGTCVRSRKGILRYRITFTGKSAHSGVNPEEGRCAVTEMARFIVRLKELEDKDRGISINPGIVTGGDSINSIPEKAECRLDIRVVEAEDAPKMEHAVEALAKDPVDRDVAIRLEGGITRPPLTPNERSDELIAAINNIAAGYDIDLKWSFSGGGSDASYASAFDIPALCGLGPVGGGYHTDKEYLETVDLEKRMCIFRDAVEAMANGKI